jgi:hypothetical protein
VFSEKPLGYFCAEDWSISVEDFAMSGDDLACPAVACSGCSAHCGSTVTKPSLLAVY